MLTWKENLSESQTLNTGIYKSLKPSIKYNTVTLNGAKQTC